MTYQMIQLILYMFIVINNYAYLIFHVKINIILSFQCFFDFVGNHDSMKMDAKYERVYKNKEQLQILNEKKNKIIFSAFESQTKTLSSISQQWKSLTSNQVNKDTQFNTFDIIDSLVQKSVVAQKKLDVELQEVDNEIKAQEICLQNALDCID